MPSSFYLKQSDSLAIQAGGATTGEAKYRMDFDEANASAVASSVKQALVEPGTLRRPIEIPAKGLLARNTDQMAENKKKESSASQKDRYPKNKLPNIAAGLAYHTQSC